MERLFENVPDLPPEDVVASVTPWKKAMRRILIGIALSTVTFNFFGLNYVLPAIGAFIVMLGFRALRDENRWFKGAFVLSVFRLITLYLALLWETTVITTGYEWISTALNTLLMLAVYVCMRWGLAALQKKAGLPVSVGGATWLIVWFLLMLVLAVVRYQGYVIAICMLVCYVLIIRSLFKISSEIDSCGYAVTASSVRLSDRWLAVLTAVFVAAGALAGYTLGGSYPMEWKPVEDKETAELTEIKSRLTELGFPREVLDDLTDEDILACKGALDVTFDTQDHPANDGRTVSEHRGNGIYTTTVYDTKELRITSVAVKLPTEREQWKVIHHFKWIAPHSRYGTECIQLWPAYRQGNGWARAGEVSGRVLCEVDGVTYTSDFYRMGDKTYTSDNPLFGTETSTDIFAEYSMHKNGDGHRGYLSYVTAESIDGYILDSWINYTHQKTWLQYPAKTAAEHRMTQGFGIDGAFITVQDALQMHEGELI